MPPISSWKREISCSESSFFQLKEREQLARVLLVDGLSEALCLFEVRLRGLAPHHVSVRRVGEATRNRLIQARIDAVEALHGSLTGQEVVIGRVHVAGNEACCVGVGPRDNDGRNAHDVGREPGGDQVPDGLGSGNQDLAAHVPALLLGGDLVLEVETRGAGFDHSLHQLEDVECATETALGVGDYRGEPIDPVPALGVMDLVGPLQRLVDPPDHVRHAVCWVQTLIRIHVPGQVGISRHLPPGEVDRLQPRLDLLHGLIARQSPQSPHERTLVHQGPEPLSAHLCQGVLDPDRTPQPRHIISHVWTLDPLPTLALPLPGDPTRPISLALHYSLLHSSIPCRYTALCTYMLTYVPTGRKERPLSCHGAWVRGRRSVA